MKLTDEELIQQITENQKNQKEIAEDNGYAYPNAGLHRRIRDLGFRPNSKITLKDNGGGRVHISKEPMQEMASQKGIDLDEAGKVFFKQVGSVEDGRIVLEMTTDSFREVENE